jgi:hypothetical protein
MSARLRWWLPAGLAAARRGRGAARGLAVVGAGDIPLALKHTHLRLLNLAGRLAERHRFRQGWFHGRADTIDEVVRRMHGRDIRTSPIAARRAVTGSDAPEPWEEREFLV